MLSSSLSPSMKWIDFLYILYRIKGEYKSFFITKVEKKNITHPPTRLINLNKNRLLKVFLIIIVLYDFVATVDVWWSKDIGVYKKQPKKNQPFNNQQHSKTNIVLQAKIYHCFLGILSVATKSIHFVEWERKDPPSAIFIKTFFKKMYRYFFHWLHSFAKHAI